MTEGKRRGSPARAPARPARPRDELLLGVLAQVAGFHLAQSSLGAEAAFRQHVGERFGLRKAEFSLLMLLLANGPLAPKRLARALALTAPNLTQLLDRLQERGLVRRERNPEDGRSQHIVLSEAGTRLSREAANAAGPMELAASHALSPAEHSMLIELLGKLSTRGAP